MYRMMIKPSNCKSKHDKILALNSFIPLHSFIGVGSGVRAEPEDLHEL